MQLDFLKAIMLSVVISRKISSNILLGLTYDIRKFVSLVVVYNNKIVYLLHYSFFILFNIPKYTFLLYTVDGITLLPFILLYPLMELMREKVLFLVAFPITITVKMTTTTTTIAKKTMTKTKKINQEKKSNWVDFVIC